MKSIRKLKNRNYTLIQKSIMFGLVPIILTSIFTQTYLILELRSSQIESKNIEMNETLEKYTIEMDALIEKISRIPQSLAHDPDILEGCEHLFSKWFTNILGLYPEIHNVYAAYESLGNLTVVYRNGTEIETRVHPHEDYQNTSQRWYDLPITEGKFVIQEAYFDEDFMGVWMISLLSPIINSTGDIIGMVGVDITLEELYKIITEISEEQNQTAFILETALNKTRILAIENPELLGENFTTYVTSTGQASLYEITQQIDDDENLFIGTFQKPDGSSHYMYSMKFRNPNVEWRLFILIPEAIILEYTNQITIIAISVSLLFILILVGIFSTLVRSIRNPIISMVKTTSEITKGNFEHTYPNRGSKEIVQLSRNFNKMIDSIRGQIDQFRTLADLSPYPMVLMIMPDRMEFVNQKFREVIGYSLEETPTLSEWFLKVFPDQDYR
ncbi:MAG: PDC sensor domain-containing protein, partial [Promethearchaeota archaeon]